MNVAALSAADQATLAIKQAAENTFLASLQTNNVKYMISGHDHHHYNSVVTSPDGNSKVHQLITASDSTKFYTPGNPVSTNDIPVEQDLARIGYLHLHRGRPARDHRLLRRRPRQLEVGQQLP